MAAGGSVALPSLVGCCIVSKAGGCILYSCWLALYIVGLRTGSFVGHVVWRMACLRAWIHGGSVCLSKWVGRDMSCIYRVSTIQLGDDDGSLVHDHPLFMSTCTVNQ